VILLEREKSNTHKMTEAVLRRLDTSDENYAYFYDLHKRMQAGFDGEKRVDREWTEITNLGKHYLLFNYEFFNEFGSSHQIDTLLITTKLLLIIDIKNISGIVDYEEDKQQFTRTQQNSTVIESFTNPKAQVLRHGEYFDRLFGKLKIALPIKHAVVFSNPSTIIGNVPKDIPFFHASGLRFFVSKLQSDYQTSLTENQINKLAKLFLSNLRRVEAKTTIEKRKFKRGVLCELCEFESQMVYQNGNWICPKCGVKSKTAFLQSLDDYRILIGNKITNREFREFFGIESFDVASKILSRSNLVPVGKNRGRHYIIPEDVNLKK